MQHILKKLAQETKNSLSSENKKAYELAARSAFSVGYYHEANEIYRTLGIEPPTDVVIACGDWLLKNGVDSISYALAYAAYEQAGSQVKLDEFGRECLKAGFYEFAIKAFKSPEQLRDLGQRCMKDGEMVIALQAFKQIGAHDLLLDLGNRCVKEDLLSVAIDAFHACGAGEKLEKIGHRAFKEWQSTPDVQTLGSRAHAAFAAANSKDELILVGEFALEIDELAIAFNAFRDAGAKEHLTKLGKKLLNKAQCVEAVDAFRLAGNEEMVFEAALALIANSRDVYCVFEAIYGRSGRKPAPPAQKFMGYAARLLGTDQEELALDIYRLLPVWCHDQFPETTTS